MQQKLKNLPFQIFCIAHSVSMAGMELLGWPLLVFGLTQFKMRLIAQQYRRTVWILIGCTTAWVVSQLVHLFSSDVSRLLSSLPWVFLLWGLFWYTIKTGAIKAIKTLDLILWTLPASAVYSIYQMFTGWDFIRHQMLEHIVGTYYRAIGFFNMPLTFAYVLGFWGCYALGKAAAEKKFSFLNLLAIFSSGICVLTSQTRGGWVAFAVVLFLAFLFFSRRQKIYSLIIASILGLGLLQNPTLMQRLHSIVDVRDKSNSQRLVLWEAHLRIFKDNPLFGVGYGQTERLLPDYYERIGHPEVKFYSYSHNNYIQHIASGGIVGALGHYFIQFFFLWAAWIVYRRKESNPTLRAFGLAALFAQIYFAVGGLTENNFYDGEVVHSTVLIWALTLAAYVHQKAEA